MMEKMDNREKQFEDLSEEERILMKELCSFFDRDHMRNNRNGRDAEVFHAKAIIEKLELNVNFPVLVYGETLLNESIHHSLEMVQMLLRMGADVNNENENVPLICYWKKKKKSESSRTRKRPSKSCSFQKVPSLPRVGKGRRSSSDGPGVNLKCKISENDS